ncbi:serine O-acetyltransferase [Rhizobium sp. TRM96647]|uniref:serine O-acetyltransferase n=1 Tax=unclassified Rhizobium TaxID=2613769 RepID=UPI0021E8555F|nr:MULTISPECIES: serine O-acetyltransferase [unclassified Rhizobium]MCV3735999.1 serine O-acetyltransferase [Rhizobium sp. TRM96647]
MQGKLQGVAQDVRDARDVQSRGLPGTGGPVWEVIRTEAMALAKREPMLRSLVQPVLISTSGTQMLVRVLATRLSAGGVDRGTLEQVMTAAADGDLLRAAEADIEAVATRDPACPGPCHVLVNLKGFQALQVHRFAHRLWRGGKRESARFLATQAALAFDVDIHPAARIGSGVMLDHGSGIVIGETAVIEDDVSILQDVTLGGTGRETGDRHPKVRRGVMIGAGAKILGNFEVGECSRVAAGSVVLKPVAARTTVAGVPAVLVRVHERAEVPAEEMSQDIL